MLIHKQQAKKGNAGKLQVFWHTFPTRSHLFILPKQFYRLEPNTQTDERINHSHWNPPNTSCFLCFMLAGQDECYNFDSCLHACLLLPYFATVIDTYPSGTTSQTKFYDISSLIQGVYHTKKKSPIQELLPECMTAVKNLTVLFFREYRGLGILA